MTVILANAIKQVRSILDESTAAFWSDDELRSWINQGAQDVARRAQTLWEETTIPVIANTQSYSFPGNFLSVHRAEYSIFGSNQTYAMEYREINTMDEVWGIIPSLQSAWPQYFTIRGNSVTGWYLMMYPSPGSSGELTVYYYRSANPAQALNQAIDVTPGWEDIVFEYAVYHAQRKSRDPVWQEAMQLYEKRLEEMINVTRRMTDQGTTITTGTPQWPLRAYDDGWSNY